MDAGKETVGADADSTDTLHAKPATEYSRRLRQRQEQLTSIGALHRRLCGYFGTVALTGLIVVGVAFSSHLISPLWTLLPVVMMVSIIQSLVKSARMHAEIWRIVSFYQLGVERLRHQWQGRGMGGAEFLPERHAYASDLDLFGAGSLYELLCTARTAVGQAMLAKWLLNPASCGQAEARQAAVAELRPMLDLREEWASVGGGALEQAGTLVHTWADAAAVEFPFFAQALAIVFPICLILLSLLAVTGILGHHWIWVVAVPAALEVLLATFLLRRTSLTAANLALPSFELELLAPLLARVETLHLECPLLKSLQSQLTASPGSPSKQIRLLRLWVWLLNLRQSEYFALLASLVLWGTNLAIRIELWRLRNRDGVTRWLDSLGQFEALLCLARYGYENPDHSFPVLQCESSSPLFRAEALGHPLLDPQTCVRCDIGLGANGPQIIVVSGSNMSGKSTLLRSVGLNSVLAFAGAPVRAARFQISQLQIGCSISVHDSVVRGTSRFQAEVERLKWIFDRSRTNRMIFLLDEMLGGTNSADRLFGARAIIEHLTTNGAVGLVTTHDLALTELVTDLNGRAMNMHFEEWYENGEMRFDYRLRPGVLTRTNGLNVMAALGLLPFRASRRDTGI